MGLGVAHKGKLDILYQARVKESTVLVYTIASVQDRNFVPSRIPVLGSRINNNEKGNRKIKKFFVALISKLLQIIKCFEQVQKKI